MFLDACLSALVITMAGAQVQRQQIEVPFDDTPLREIQGQARFRPPSDRPRLILNMQVGARGEPKKPANAEEMVELLRSSLPQPFIDALVWEYGFVPQNKLARSARETLARSVDLSRFLYDIWDLRSRQAKLARQVRCMTTGELSLLPIFVRVAEDEVREKDLKQRTDVARDYNPYTSFALARHLEVVCVDANGGL